MEELKELFDHLIENPDKVKPLKKLAFKTQDAENIGNNKMTSKDNSVPVWEPKEVRTFADVDREFLWTWIEGHQDNATPDAIMSSYSKKGHIPARQAVTLVTGMPMDFPITGDLLVKVNFRAALDALLAEKGNHLINGLMQECHENGKLKLNGKPHGLFRFDQDPVDTETDDPRAVTVTYNPTKVTAAIPKKLFFGIDEPIENNFSPHSACVRFMTRPIPLHTWFDKGQIPKVELASFVGKVTSTVQMFKLGKRGPEISCDENLRANLKRARPTAGPAAPKEIVVDGNSAFAILDDEADTGAPSVANGAGGAVNNVVDHDAPLPPIEVAHSTEVAPLSPTGGAHTAIESPSVGNNTEDGSELG
jgi:hypothetical protein